MTDNNLTIEDIKNHTDDLDQLLSIVHELVTHSYGIGYANGYVSGRYDIEEEQE